MSEVQVTRVVGDDAECVIIDAAHDAGPIRDAVRDRRVTAVLLSHAHDDHIGAVEPLCAATGAPSYLHPYARVLWEKKYAAAPDRELADGGAEAGDLEAWVARGD